MMSQVYRCPHLLRIAQWARPTFTGFPDLRASAPLREHSPSAAIRANLVIRGFLLSLTAIIALCSGASAQEDVAETPKAKTVIDQTPITESAISTADRSHWSFAPIQRQALPQVKQQAWLQTSIDAFILAKLESKDISPAPQADRATLLRRLSFDLVGLPPSPDELTAFETDKSPDAYDRHVDRLLASPTFGERWGQYWLDLARFAETDGFEHDKVRPTAWKYRDWVIAALNSDMPYDEFVRLQLAGDELVSDSTPGPQPLAPSPSTASMFCLSGPDMPDVNDQAERRHNLLNELTGAVGSVFLGLQIGCAQCHDHKYDPLSQADFYRLRAVFEPAVATLKRDVAYNSMSIQKDTAPARLWVRGDHRRPGLELVAAFPRIASSPLPLGEGGRRAGEGALGAAAGLSSNGGHRTELASWLVRADNPLTSRVIANRLWQHHFGRGICQTPSDFGVMSGDVTHPELLDWLAVELRDRGWGMKRLHRQILSSATYRQSSTQYSVLSTQYSPLPTGSPSLLPAVSPSSSEPRTLNPEPTAADPENSLYSHFPRQRLNGESIRDAMLSAAGLLTSERGGPGVMPPLPQELLSTLLKNQWNASKREADHYKRSIYVFARRNLRYPIFEAFDRPDGNASCPLRSRSTTAPQSLLLFNSEFSLLAARHLAGRVIAEATELQQQIDKLYAIALSRRPSNTEVTTLEKFLTAQRQRLIAESRPRDALALPVSSPDSTDAHASAALVDACLAVLNSNEFIYID